MQTANIKDHCNQIRLNLTFNNRCILTKRAFKCQLTEVNTIGRQQRSYFDMSNVQLRSSGYLIQVWDAQTGGNDLKTF